MCDQNVPDRARYILELWNSFLEFGVVQPNPQLECNCNGNCITCGYHSKRKPRVKKGSHIRCTCHKITYTPVFMCKKLHKQEPIHYIVVREPFRMQQTLRTKQFSFTHGSTWDQEWVMAER